MAMLTLCVQDFTTTAVTLLPSFNEFHPVDDFGLLDRYLDPTNLFTLYILVGLVGGFLLSWFLAVCVDRYAPTRLRWLMPERLWMWSQRESQDTAASA